MLSERTIASDLERGSADEARLVADVSGLVSPPTVCVKMFELVQSAQASADEIGDVVASDPNLTARLLRIVNSSFYGFPSRIDSISRAITILGTSDLYNLALAISAVRSFSNVGAGLVRMEALWSHSIFCALVARHLAKHRGLPDADRLFVAGLLHDIGISVIYRQLPNVAPRMRSVAQAGEAALWAAELEQFGFSHASVGARLLEAWQLPVALREAIRHHHDPGAAPSARIEAALVHLADVLANRSETGAFWANPTSTPEVDGAVWDALGTEPESLDVKQVLGDASAEFAETARNLMPARGR